MNDSQSFDDYIPTTLTNFTKIPEDGACLYHCFSTYLSQKDEIYWKNMTRHFEKENITFPVSDMSKEFSKLPLEKKSRWVQKTIINWIYENKDKPCFFSKIGESLSVETIVMSSIDLEEITSFEQFYKTYQIYAGDPDYIYEENPEFSLLFQNTEKKNTDFLCKETEKKKMETRMETRSISKKEKLTKIESQNKQNSQSNRKKKNKIPIPYRWGGYSDICVFSYLFQTTIELFELMRPNKDDEMQNCSLRFYKSSFLKKQDTFIPFLLNHEISFSSSSDIKEKFNDESIKDIYLNHTLNLLYGGNKKSNKNHYSLFEWL